MMCIALTTLLIARMAIAFPSRRNAECGSAPLTCQEETQNRSGTPKLAQACCLRYVIPSPSPTRRLHITRRLPLRVRYQAYLCRAAVFAQRTLSRLARSFFPQSERYHHELDQTAEAAQGAAHGQEWSRQVINEKHRF